MTEQLHFLEDANFPSGFNYLPGFVTKAEEIKLLKFIQELNEKSFKKDGVESKRKVIQYGLDSDFYTRAISKNQNIPQWLEQLKQKSEKFLVGEVKEILITHYPPMSGIGWHIDAPAFGSLLVISLLGKCRWMMRKDDRKFEIELEPRSAYIITDEARWLWEYHIPPIKEDRYSITFRTLVA